MLDVIYFNFPLSTSGLKLSLRHDLTFLYILYLLWLCLELDVVLMLVTSGHDQAIQASFHTQ